MVVSMTHPHDPFAIPRRILGPLRRRRDRRCRARSRRTALDAAFAAGSGDVCDMDGEIADEQQVRSARRAYYGAISYVDDQIGRVLRRA